MGMACGVSPLCASGDDRENRYVRNAVKDPGHKPWPDVEHWQGEVLREPEMNYFDFVGGKLAGVLLQHRGRFGPWIQ
jgi:hypothetical protein